MPHEESLYPADWLRIAEKDLGRVENLLGIQDPEASVTLSSRRLV